jgi:hypothetical protein
MKDCMAWREGDCNLIRRAGESLTPFEHNLRNAAPLMYRSLLDLVKIMEDTSQGWVSADLICGTMPRKLDQTFWMS